MPKVLEVIWGVRKQKYFSNPGWTLICPTGGFLGKRALRGGGQVAGAPLIDEFTPQ
jgi:hypothetical protein